MSSSNVMWKRLLKKSLWGIAPLVILLVIAACGGSAPAAAPTTAPEATATTESATATPEPAATSGEAMTSTETMTSTEAMTGTEEMTSTETATSTEAMTTTEAMTGTESMTGTGTMTSTGTMTGTGTTTGTSSAPDTGAYIVAISGGCGCHMNRDLGGLAGGNEFTVTTGTVYAPNLTPDKETGIGDWTAEQVATALLTGVDDEGKQLHPVMPYKTLSVLSQQEALAVGTYLLAQKPIANEVPERKLSEEPAAFTPTEASPAEAPTDSVARGHEIVTIANCAGCHTPKNADGTMNADMMLAGAPLRGDEIAANITPDEETGIGKWTEDEIAVFMRTGKESDGSQVEGAMAQQIERRFSKLTEADAKAIAAYLKSIPAIKNEPKKAQ